MLDVYRVSADGGTPAIVAGDRYATEYFAAPGPDANVVAVSAPGDRVVPVVAQGT